MSIRLTIPHDFHSTLTYQNSNYTYPHTGILTLNFRDVKNWFYDLNFFIPDYIHYYKEDVDVNEVMTILENNNNFTILGVSFMKFKGLEEGWENLVNESIQWSNNHTIPKVQPMIDIFINDDLLDYGIEISYMTNMIQIMIINIINYVVDHLDFPLWMNDNKFKELIYNLNQIVNLKMINIPVSETIFLAQAMPSIKAIEQIMNQSIVYY